MIPLELVVWIGGGTLVLVLIWKFLTSGLN
jgi:hypothetical protein